MPRTLTRRLAFGGLLLIALTAAPGAAQEAPGDWGRIEFLRDRGITRGLIPAPSDTVWQALRAIFADFGLKATEVEPTVRLANPRQRAIRRLGKEALSRIFSCGENLTGPNADTYHVFIRFGVGLVPSGRDTAFEFAMYADAIDVPGGHPERITCATTGRLELNLVDRLDALFPGTK